MGSKLKILLLLAIICFVKINAKPQPQLDGLLGQASNPANILQNEQKMSESKSITGNGNTNLDVLDVSPQLSVVANVLSPVKQILGLGGSGSGLGSPQNVKSRSQTQTDESNTIGSGNTDIGVGKVNPQLDASANVLSSLTQGVLGGGGPTGGGGLSNVIGTSQSQKDTKNIVGDNNVVIDAVKADPQLNVGANVLSDVTQLILPNSGPPKPPAPSTGVPNPNSKPNPINPQPKPAPGNAGNIIGNNQNLESNTNVVGNNNLLVNLLDVGLQGIVNADVLSDTTQLAGGGGGGGSNIISNSQTRNSGKNIMGDGNLGILGPEIAPQILADVDVANGLLQGVGLDGLTNSGKNSQELKQTSNDKTNVVGNGNTVLGLGQIAPQAIVKLDVLSETTQLLKLIQDPKLLINGLNGNDAECENAMKIIQEQNSELNVEGDNNVIIELLKVNPQIALDLNILSNLLQTGKCEFNPRPPTPSPPTPLPPTPSPPTPSPPTPSPPTPSPPIPCPPMPCPTCPPPLSCPPCPPQPPCPTCPTHPPPKPCPPMPCPPIPCPPPPPCPSCPVPPPPKPCPPRPQCPSCPPSPHPYHSPVLTPNPTRGVSNSQTNAQTIESSSNVIGDNNVILDLLDVNLQGIVNADVLSGSKQVTGGKGGSNSISNSQTRNSETNIVGDGNLAVLGPEIAPQILADVDVANGLLGGLGLGGLTNNGQNTQELKQTSNDKTNFVGNGNTVLGLGQISPQAIVKLDVLSQTTQLLGILNNPGLLLKGLNGNDAECENTLKTVQEQTSELNVKGDNNVIIELLRLNPQIAIDLNILSGLLQSGKCEFRPKPPGPTPKPTLPPTPRPPGKRCFRRVCRKWRVKPEYMCQH